MSFFMKNYKSSSYEDFFSKIPLKEKDHLSSSEIYSTILHRFYFLNDFKNKKAAFDSAMTAKSGVEGNRTPVQTQLP